MIAFLMIVIVVLCISEGLNNGIGGIETMVLHR
jgi:hypothetical protein